MDLSQVWQKQVVTLAENEAGEGLGGMRARVKPRGPWIKSPGRCLPYLPFYVMGTHSCSSKGFWRIRWCLQGLSDPDPVQSQQACFHAAAVRSLWRPTCHLTTHLLSFQFRFSKSPKEAVAPKSSFNDTTPWQPQFLLWPAITLQREQAACQDTWTKKFFLQSVSTPLFACCEVT